MLVSGLVAACRVTSARIFTSYDYTFRVTFVGIFASCSCCNYSFRVVCMLLFLSSPAASSHWCCACSNTCARSCLFQHCKNPMTFNYHQLRSTVLPAFLALPFQNYGISMYLWCVHCIGPLFECMFACPTNETHMLLMCPKHRQNGCNIAKSL